MRWAFEVEGQPLSWNAAYRVGKVKRTGERGRIRLDSNGQEFMASTIVKTDKAKTYTELVAYRALEKAPKNWAPEGFVVVEIYYFLGRDIDCDNVMKLVDDGLEMATGVNDRWFLPRAMSKTTGLRPDQRHIRVVVEDIGSPS